MSLDGGDGSVRDLHPIERRRHARKACFVSVDYAVEERLHRDFIQNISAGGALIETRNRFFEGQEVSLSFQLPEALRPVQITGHIAWASRLGFGVKFRFGKLEFTPLKGQELDLSGPEVGQETPIGIKKEGSKMGKVKKKRLRWQPSASLDVIRYRLYWSKYGDVNYSSAHADLDNVTELTLPDDIPSFPLDTGDMELGISAINQVGNESEIAKLTAHFNFSLPDPPQNLELEDV